MGWVDRAIVLLRNGKVAQVKPHGNSMIPLIHSGNKVTIKPVQLDNLSVGDIVLCRVRGNQYLHLIKAIDGERFLIGNSKGRINGWTKAIYGKVILVES